MLLFDLRVVAFLEDEGFDLTHEAGLHVLADWLNLVNFRSFEEFAPKGVGSLLSRLAVSSWLRENLVARLGLIVGGQAKLNVPLALIQRGEIHFRVPV